MFSDNEVDDKVKNRKPNISLYSNIFGKEFKRITKKEYARNTCIKNREYEVDISPGGFVGKGSFGVARIGKYISLKDGKIKNGIVKIIINKFNNELQEIKIGIEASILCPEAVVDIELLNRCDILTRLNPKIDNYNTNEDLIIIGMEKGISLDKYIDINYKNKNKILKIGLSAIEACDLFNIYGFFHNDIKPANMIVVKRNGVDKAVLIDFGKTEYMNSIRYIGNKNKSIVRDFSLINPPFDSFYLSLILFGYSDIFFKSLLNYYFIMLACGITKDELEQIYTSFKHYSLHKKLIKFYNKIVDENISLNISEKYIKYANDRKSHVAQIKKKIKNNIIKEPISFDKLRSSLNKYGPAQISSGGDNSNTMISIVKPICSPKKKSKNSNELTLKEAKLLCKKNNIIQTGNKKEICERLSRMKIVL